MVERRIELINARGDDDREFSESRGKGVDMVSGDAALPLIVAPDGGDAGPRQGAIVVSASDLADGPRDIED